VSVHFTVNGEIAKTFSSGTQIITGPITADFTANGQIISLNISGPVFLYPHDDSVTIIARGVGAGPIMTSSGVTLAEAAGPVLLSASGAPVLEHATILLDLCQALSS
jgi:hypothetical protein